MPSLRGAHPQKNIPRGQHGEFTRESSEAIWEDPAHYVKMMDVLHDDIGVCYACGCHYDSRTPGCITCRDRHYARRRRAELYHENWGDVQYHW